jgi:ribosome biogenesis GTPase
MSKATEAKRTPTTEEPEQDSLLPGRESIRRSHEDRARHRHKTTKHRERLGVQAQIGGTPTEDLLTGRVVRSDGQYYIVDIDDSGELRTKTSKRTIAAEPNATLVTIGDRVRVEPHPESVALIAEVLPRTTKLLRRASGRSDAFAQVIVANIDTLVIVTSILEPPLSTGIIDRYIVAGLDGGMAIAIVFNKIDLLKTKAGKEVLDEYLGIYRSIGYQCFAASAEKASTLDPLREFLIGKTSVFAGHSGVGKTSLVNTLRGDEAERIGVLSKKYRRGAHTTSRSVLLKLGDVSGTYIVDTPGVREFANHEIDPENLKFFFEEFLRFSDECAIPNCSHLHEPDCAVIAAVEESAISVERYANYEKLYQEAKAQDKKLREKS